MSNNTRSTGALYSIPANEQVPVLSGHNPKEFKLADASLLTKLIDTLTTNEDCSYVTYVNEEIKSNNIPDKIRVINKVISKENIYNEVCASKIFNYFGIPTVYNQLYLEEIKPKSLFTKQKNSLISVNYMPDNCTEFSLETYGKNPSFNTPLSSWIKTIKDTLDEYYSHYSHQEITGSKRIETTDSIINKFVESYMIRTGVLNDFDLCGEKIKFIKDNANNLTLAPQHDFESCFFTLKRNLQLLRENMQYCAEEFPIIYDNFINNINCALQKDDCDQTIFDNIVAEETNNSPLYRFQIARVANERCEQVKYINDRYIAPMQAEHNN